jgi:dTDP-4-amino-4,6-dideoxygalactose transaminase
MPEPAFARSQVSIAQKPAIRFVDIQAQTASLQPALMEAISRVVQRGDFILGEDVQRFEADFAAYCGVRFAIGVDSGLSALELALRGIGIGPGDEVITQANTFIATVGGIQATGAKPVLVDCDRHGAFDPQAFEAAVTPRTRAVMPVHLFGRLGDIDRVVALAERRRLAVIEDACQAHGAVLGGRRAGSFGVAAAFSFYPAKNLGAFGDGGMLVTSSEEVVAAARQLRNYGQMAKYQHIALPLNHRLDTLQAAVLRVKLPHLDRWNARRQELADAYRKELAGLPLGLPPAEASGRHIYHLFVAETERRDGLREALSSAGIESGIHYPVPVHLQPVLAGLGYRRGAFPNAERLASTSLSLPMYPELTVEEIKRVATATRLFFQS